MAVVTGNQTAPPVRQSPCERRLTSLDHIATEPDDTGLVERARSGDRDALEQVLGLHYDRVFAVCRRMTGNDADAADAAQETLIAVVRGLPRFDGRSRLSTWIYRLAVNASIDELRRRARRPAVGLDPGRESSRVGALAGRPDGPGGSAVGGLPPDDPESVADRVDIDAALRGLPAEFRAAVVLRDLCGLDYAEIAEVLDVPPGTVRSRIAAGPGPSGPAVGAARGRAVSDLGREPMSTGWCTLPWRVHQ